MRGLNNFLSTPILLYLTALLQSTIYSHGEVTELKTTYCLQGMPGDMVNRSMHLCSNLQLKPKESSKSQKLSSDVTATT